MHVQAGEYWRLASYMVLHIGWAHLILNTWAGVSWCAAVERALGARRFLLVYVLSGIGGGAACALFSRSLTAGASGAMFGITGALLAIRFRTLGSFARFAADRGVRATLSQIAIWTVLGVVALPISQSAHFGGLITGALVTLILMLPQRGGAWAGFSFAFLVFLLVATKPWNLMEARARTTLSVDWADLKIDRLGQPKHDMPVVVLSAAKPACERGVVRACIIQAIPAIDPDDHPGCVRDYALFERACTHGDGDACAGQGMLLGTGCGVPQDVEKSTELLRRSCEMGSEYGCELKL